MKNSSSTSGTSISMLLYLSLAHLFNDAFQSTVSAVYPVIRDNLSLTFGQIGLIVLVYQLCASVFQPIFGVLFDKRPQAWYLSAGTISTMVGLLMLAFAHSIYLVMGAVAFIGLGSSVIHPEASRLTHFASGGRHGLAQSIFQVGGNFGGSIGPLLAAAIVAPYGQRYIAVFAGISIISLLTKSPIVKWYRKKIRLMRSVSAKKVVVHRVRLSKRKIYFSLALLLALIFSKYVYMASLSNFYTFYLIEKFGVTTQQSQLFLFAFLFASAVGTLLGGPIGDRFGRKYVIWISILGTAPFSLMMPYASLMWTCVLSVAIGVVLSSAFSAILVYAQELLPTRIGLISGLFFGLAFGIAGIAAAVLGNIADVKSLAYVYKLCSFVPLLGAVAIFLPNVKRKLPVALP
ncbi:MAG: MFS transporter [Prevotellaceae bacterium]|jgi:FSR family fosmidomycin resistance protein-like MFS transporter|nr:MFS transporter [Prevotellaceae bacterium]